MAVQGSCISLEDPLGEHQQCILYMESCEAHDTNLESIG